MENQTEIELEEQEETFTCEECSESDLSESQVTECELVSGMGCSTTQLLCEACESDLCYSQQEGVYLHPDIAVWVESFDDYLPEWNCDSCQDCGDMEASSDMHSVLNGEVCSGCFDNYGYAEDVGEYVHSDDLAYCENCDVYNFRECEECGRYLLSYSTDVLQVQGYYGMVRGVWENLHRNTALLMGVELECDSRGSSSAEELAELVCTNGFQDFGICKRDATVSGIEMVSRPADLESHKLQEWETWLKLLQPVAKGHYAQSAGMHVHVNTHGMSPLTIGKILYFMNSRNNRAMLELVAQRDLGTHWCEVKPDSCTSIGKLGKEPRLGKYSAANFTGRTLEFRIFRSTLLPARFYKNLEAVDSIVRFCKQSSAQCAELTTEAWLSFVDDNRSAYPNLSTFVYSRLEA